MIIHVIMASHNRRDLTIESVSSLFASAKQGSSSVQVTVFDDGSTDGTAGALASQFSDIKTIQGDGSCFWAAAMAAAERNVLERAGLSDDDCLLWLNDDVVLDLDAIGRLEACLAGASEGIVVGAVRDPITGLPTYSGLRRKGLHPLNFGRLQPDPSSPLPVETFNGNFVAVRVGIARRLGGIDGEFAHAFADIDYGLRAQRNGIPVVLAPGTFGTCANNPVAQRGSIWSDWKRFTGIKGGGNLPSIVRILKRSAPLTWPIYVTATYALWWARQAKARISD